MELRIISIVNQKGGVGKTTSSINIASALSISGKKVLLIDLDPQGNLSQSLGIIKDTEKTIFEALKGIEDVNDIIISKNDSLDLISSNIRLSEAEIEFSTIPGREFLLKETIKKIKKKYDYIIIDCSPSLGVLTLNALTSSKEILIPVQTQYLALQGITQLLRIIEMVKERINNNIELSGVFLTMFDKRKRLSKEIESAVSETFDKLLFKTRIRDCVALAEAPSHALDIFKYKPESNGALDYKLLTQEIIKQEKNVKIKK